MRRSCDRYLLQCKMHAGQMLYCHVRGTVQERQKLMILKYILQQPKIQENFNTSIICMCVLYVTFDLLLSLIIYLSFGEVCMLCFYIATQLLTWCQMLTPIHVNNEAYLNIRAQI